MRPKIRRKPGYRKSCKLNKRWMKVVNKKLFKYWLDHPEQYNDPSYIVVIDHNTNTPYILHINGPVIHKTTIELKTSEGKTLETTFEVNKVRLPRDVNDIMESTADMFNQWVSGLKSEEEKNNET